MPATIDKLLGRPLLHKHQIADITVTVDGDVNTTSVTDPPVTVNTVAGDYSVVLADATSGNLTITLPNASSNKNKIYKIKKIDSSAFQVTVQGNSTGQKIDGDTTKEISYQYSALQLVCNGSNWYII
jgi:hypothetical protein